MAVYQIVKAATSVAAGFGASKIVGTYCAMTKTALSNQNTINKVCHFCGQVALELAAYNIASKTIDETFKSYENMAHDIKVTITKANKEVNKEPEEASSTVHEMPYYYRAMQEELDRLKKEIDSAKENVERS